MKISCFTVSLPDTTPEQSIRQLKKHGYDGAEWRVHSDKEPAAAPGFWKGNRCTLQDDWTDAQYKAVADMAKSEGLAAPCLGSYVAARNLPLVKRMMEVANLFGAPMLRVNFTAFDATVSYPDLFKRELDDYAKVVEAGKQYKVKPLIEIHMGNITPSASAAYRFVSNFKPSEVGAIHDAGNMVYEGYESYKNGVELLGPYLAHVHIKNSMPISEPAKSGPQRVFWKTAAAPLRFGQVDFVNLLGVLKKAGYAGWLSVEDFSTESSQEEKVKDNIAFLKEIEAGL